MLRSKLDIEGLGCAKLSQATKSTKFWGKMTEVSLTHIKKILKKGDAKQALQLLVDLQPGETISVLSVTHVESGKTKERISLNRNGEMLLLRREGDGAKACFTYPS